jgi:hypothetical protein
VPSLRRSSTLHLRVTALAVDPQSCGAQGSREVRMQRDLSKGVEAAHRLLLAQCALQRLQPLGDGVCDLGE